MKVVAILLVSLSLALAIDINTSEKEKQSERGADWSDKPSERDVASTVKNVTQCIFRAENKVIDCRGVGGEVECPVAFEWPKSGVQSYKIFGLGVASEFIAAKNELVRYFLYPRQSDNITYVNHTLILDGGARDIFLYYGEKFVEYGLRVTDAKCFQRLVGLLRKSSLELMIPLVSDLEIKPVVPMIGEVLIFDKDVSKRWLHGFGFGGLWGWPLFNPFFNPWGIWGR